MSVSGRTVECQSAHRRFELLIQRQWCALLLMSVNGPTLTKGQKFPRFLMYHLILARRTMVGVMVSKRQKYLELPCKHSDRHPHRYLRSRGIAPTNILTSRFCPQDSPGLNSPPAASARCVHGHCPFHHQPACRPRAPRPAIRIRAPAPAVPAWRHGGACASTRAGPFPGQARASDGARSAVGCRGADGGGARRSVPEAGGQPPGDRQAEQSAPALLSQLCGARLC